MLNDILDAARAASSRGDWEAALAGYEKAITVAVRHSCAGDIADIFLSIGDLHCERGNLELAADVFGVSRAIADANRLPVTACAASIGLGNVEYHRGDLRAAEALFRKARIEAARLGQTRRIAAIDQKLGAIAGLRGDLEGAVYRYEDALEHLEAAGDSLQMVEVLTELGSIHIELTDWAAAERCFDRAATIADRLKVAALLGHVEINRVELHLRSRDIQRARECCDRALALYGSVESAAGVAQTHRWYGVIFRDSHDEEMANMHLRTAVDVARGGDHRLIEAEALAEWAVVHMNAERHREAVLCLNQAHEIFAELHSRREILDLDRRLDDLEDSYLLVARAWAELIESKDDYTDGHCERVANLACLLGRALGIRGRELTWLRVGGYLHDIGKISVPAELLNKAGSLTAEEWARVQQHTVTGDRLVAELGFPWDIRPVVRSHHERWDGYGYPDGLSGSAIPVTARIVGLADVYDALTTDRSFRAAFSREEALRIMDSEIERTFDPEMFRLFRSLVLGRLPRGDHRAAPIRFSRPSIRLDPAPEPVA